jgi:hypothetical protein
MIVSYKLADEGVVWENIGGQIVMANLSSGRYCSMSEKSSVLLWELIIGGTSLNIIHKHLSNHFKNYDETAINQINSCLDKLIQLGFLIKDQEGIEKDLEIAYQDEQKFLEDFSEPKLLFYDDIDTLLQLDPIDDQVEELMKEYNE